MDFIQWRSCASKIRYARRIDAARAAHHLPKRRGMRAHAYRCAFCPGFHVGHRAKVRRPRRERA